MSIVRNRHREFWLPSGVRLAEVATHAPPVLEFLGFFDYHLDIVL
jgi:hypothetical protein